jgi:hypothetical protein
MSEDFLERKVLGRVPMDRRAFVKKLVLGAAFAVPAIASFDMLTSTTGYGTVGPNGGRQGQICRSKVDERDWLQQTLHNLPANAPAALKTRLQSKINSVDAYLAANC